MLSFIFGTVSGVLVAWVFFPAPESASELIHKIRIQLGLK